MATTSQETKTVKVLPWHYNYQQIPKELGFDNREPESRLTVLEGIIAEGTPGVGERMAYRGFIGCPLCSHVETRVEYKLVRNGIEYEWQMLLHHLLLEHHVYPQEQLLTLVEMDITEIPKL